MTAKTKTLRLTLYRVMRVERMTEDNPEGTAYEVKQVTNSIDPAVGDLLTPERADRYAQTEYWEVTFK